MKRPTLRELIPAAIVLVFLGAAAALVLELLVAAASGKAADPASTTALISLLGLCVPALVSLYFRDSKPPEPPAPSTEDDVAEKARQVLADYLERTKNEIRGWRPRWRPCS